MRIFFFILFFANVCFGQQNLKENYVPIKSSGALPAVFTQNVRDVIKKEQDDLNQSSGQDKALKNTYITNTHYQIERIIRSGNVLLNDEVTQYINKVADVILKNDPALRKQLSIYTLKSPVVNAYTFDKGYIFIDIGLIAQLESEAQLAYILCHEISHYTLHHHIKGYIKDSKVSRKNYDGKSFEDRLIEKCQYSKETESEADTEGLRLFEKTNYSLKQVGKVFDVLQYSNLPFELVEFKKSFFETPGYKIPQSYFSERVSPIIDNSNLDDSKQTHPNTAKRKQNISEAVADKNNSGKVNAIVGKERFEYIRDISRLEMCRLYLKQRDYGNSLYAAYIIQEKYPNNQYVSEIICKSVLAIALYKNDSIRYNDHSYLQQGIPTPSLIEGSPQQLYQLIYIMPKNEWTFLALNYVYRQHKKFPSNTIINNCSENLFGLVKKVDWEISDFSRISKEKELEERKRDSLEPVSKTDLIARSTRLTSDNRIEDSVYYKNMYLDLFMTDETFKRKFPLRSAHNDVIPKKAKEEKYRENWHQNDVVVNKVLLLEPFYSQVNLSKNEKFLFMSSDKKQENFINTVNKCAGLQKFELITIDPGLMTSGEVGKINDYAVINDWLEEKLDSDQSRISIFNTNDIDGIVRKYGTPYVLKTGLISVKKLSRKSTYFYAALFDIKTNQVVYSKYERFSKKDKPDLVNAKTYEMIYELRNCKITKPKNEDEAR